MGAKIRQLDKWINSGGHRTYVFDTPRNEKEAQDFRQDRCEYDEDKRIVHLQYFTDTNEWISERHAKLQMEKYMRSNVSKSARMFCSVENIKTSRTKGLSSKVNVLWLANSEPTPDQLKDIVERITQLPMTAPLKVDEMNYYERLKLTGTTKEDDGTFEYQDDKWIQNQQNGGFF